MSPSEIKELIGLLPDIFINFIPGSIFLFIFYFICSKEIEKEDNKYFIFKSIITSYILINTFELFQRILDNFFVYEISNLAFKIYIMIYSVVISYLVSKIYLSECFQWIIGKFGINRSLHTKIWNDITDWKLGMWVEVYLSSERVIYRGVLKKYEDKDDNYFIFLNRYKLLDYDRKPIRNKKFEDKKENWVAINSKDISRIELFYHPQSSKVN